MYSQQAKNIIYEAITKNGILASSEKVDNYNRVWSRDSMMTGILGLLIQDEKIITANLHSILTLANYQAETGALPSNVSIFEGVGKASYGTLVGRVDATTWWIIGTCKYLEYSKNENLKIELLPKIEKALQCLKAWEFNNRGLIYTPIGGNWADEYITTGYTLYDNVLRYWALKSYAELTKNTEHNNLALKTKTLIEENFTKNNSNPSKYHQNAYEKTLEKPYFFAALSANGYDDRFDLAGNALAMLLDFNLNIEEFENYLEYLNSIFQHWMLPVFYPIIFPKDDDWKLLAQNYNYDFKNNPFHFHNGGSWPIFLGWLCLGLNKKSNSKISEKILLNFEKLLGLQTNPFNEYYTTDHLQALGTNKLCFSAVGYLLMTIKNNAIKI